MFDVRITPFDPKRPFTTTLANGRIGWIVLKNSLATVV
jgi:hypothetical protein